MAKKDENRFFEKIFFRLPPNCFYVPKMKFLALKGKKKPFVDWCAPLINVDLSLQLLLKIERFRFSWSYLYRLSYLKVKFYRLSFLKVNFYCSSFGFEIYCLSFGGESSSFIVFGGLSTIRLETPPLKYPLLNPLNPVICIPPLNR